VRRQPRGPLGIGRYQQEMTLTPFSHRPILVFGYGNPSRGDDALGPLLIERLQERKEAGELHGADLLIDFQIQVEHALDLRGREFVVFVDAASTGPEPYSFDSVEAASEVGYSTHVMTPGALLRVLEMIADEHGPEVRLLAIRGYRFDLGSPISASARVNLEKAVEFLVQRIVACGFQSD